MLCLGVDITKLCLHLLSHVAQLNLHLLFLVVEQLLKGFNLKLSF